MRDTVNRGIDAKRSDTGATIKETRLSLGSSSPENKRILKQITTVTTNFKSNWFLYVMNLHDQRSQSKTSRILSRFHDNLALPIYITPGWKEISSG